MKLALVVQRYGADIAGGSETHCRHLAEHLAAQHDVTVLTTCARDYVTWQNAYAAGISVGDGVQVIRFPVAHRRNLKLFADLGDVVFQGEAVPELEHAWFQANGPVAPALLEHLRAHGAEYDLVLFWAFRYWPTWFGLPIVADRAVLVPTAEEDPAIELSVVYEFFRRPAGYLFLTPEEEALVCSRAGRTLRPAAVIGTGLEPAGASPSRDAIERLGISSDYVLYLGRVDRNKGCQTLLEYFQDFLAAGGDTTLVLAGPATLTVPAHPRIRALGYVSEEARLSLLAHARALVVPSPYESLSMVLLEAWNQGTPALVNSGCRVLAGQVSRASGGLAYRSSMEFQEELAWLLAHEDERAALGRQGLAYVDREYRWPIVLDRVEGLLRQARAAR